MSGVLIFSRAFTNHGHLQTPSLRSPNSSTQAVGTVFPSSQSCFPFVTPVSTHNVPPKPPSIPNWISVSSRSPIIQALFLSNRNLPSMASIMAWLGLPRLVGCLPPSIATKGAEQAPAPGNRVDEEGKVVSIFVARNTAPWRR